MDTHRGGFEDALKTAHKDICRGAYERFLQWLVRGGSPWRVPEGYIQICAVTEVAPRSRIEHFLIRTKSQRGL